MGSNMIRLLRGSSGISLSENREMCFTSLILKGSDLPLPAPGKGAWFSFCSCLENSVGFGMFMGILSQTAKGLCFVTTQLKLLLGIWELKEEVTKKPSSVVCVQVVFVFNISFNIDIQERRIRSKGPEEMELLPCKPG